MHMAERLWALTLESILAVESRSALFGPPKRCTVAELLHIAYDSDNDSAHIGIILPCEVFAPSLLNMHECLK